MRVPMRRRMLRCRKEDVRASKRARRFSARRFWRGVICALVGGAMWGFSGSCAQYLYAHYDISPLFITWVRMLGSGVLFLVLLVATQRARVSQLLSDGGSVARLALFGVGGLFLCQLTFAISVNATNAGTATVLQSTNTVFIMLFTCLSLRKPPHVLEFVGLVLAIAATWLIATQGDPSTLVLPVAGLVWGLLNALSCTFYIMYPKRLFARWGSLMVTASACSSAG